MGKFSKTMPFVALVFPLLCIWAQISVLDIHLKYHGDYKPIDDFTVGYFKGWWKIGLIFASPFLAFNLWRGNASRKYWVVLFSLFLLVTVAGFTFDYFIWPQAYADPPRRWP